MNAWRLAMAFTCACAPRAITPSPASCPVDTHVDGAECVDNTPVSRGAYRRCAEANDACAPPPFREYVAWGSDHALEPMTSVTIDAARAYCAHAGRTLDQKEWPHFRCRAKPGAKAVAAVSATPRPPPAVFAATDGVGAFPRDLVFGVPLIAGAVTCARVIAEKGTLTFPGRKLPFAVRDGVVRITSDGCVADWAIGDTESGRTYIGGSPWVSGDLTCGPTPPLRPLAAPCTPIATKLVADERVMYVRDPHGGCARAAVHAASRAPILRIEGALRDRFYALADLGVGDQIFVGAIDDEPQMLPTGVQPHRASVAGYHIGDATLFFDRAACMSAKPAAYIDDERTFRRRIFAAWARFFGGRSEAFFVDASGERCQRAAVRVAQGSAFIGALGGYSFVVDGDGVSLTAGGCSEHYELRTADAGLRSIGVGSSTLFATMEACESQRTTTPPFAQRCTTAPAAKGGLATRVHIDGYAASRDGGCAATTVDFSPSWAVRGAATAFDGQWKLDGRSIDVFESPSGKLIFRADQGKWVSALPIYSSKVGCLAAL